MGQLAAGCQVDEPHLVRRYVKSVEETRAPESRFEVFPTRKCTIPSNHLADEDTGPIKCSKSRYCHELPTAALRFGGRNVFPGNSKWSIGDGTNVEVT